MQLQCFKKLFPQDITNWILNMRYHKNKIMVTIINKNDSDVLIINGLPDQAHVTILAKMIQCEIYCWKSETH